MRNTIVCIGDSLTYGKNWGFNNDLRKTVSVRLAEKYPGIQVVNLGINGDFAANLNSRKADADLYRPFRVIVMIGINDISGGETANNLQTQLQAIYTYYSNQGYRVTALTITPRDDENSTKNNVRNTVNNWILNTATGVTDRIDAWTIIRDPQDTGKRLPAYADPDTPNHFNDDGWAAIVQNL